MQTIQLKDTEARIAKIEVAEGSTTVTLEWGGPDDMYVQHFDIDRLGKLCRGIGQPYGGNLCGGWVMLDGPCLLKEGDVIPALERENSDEE